MIMRMTSAVQSYKMQWLLISTEELPGKEQMLKWII